MFTKFLTHPIRSAASLAIALSVLAGCAVSLPPAPTSDPANPSAPSAASAPLRPHLLASSRNFLSPHVDDREQNTKRRTVGQKKEGAMVAATYYTCPMHPEIHEAYPGECSKCGMTLVKKTAAPEGTEP